MTDTDKRAAYIEGLHQIADFLAEHPEVPLPHLSSHIGDEYGPILTIWLVRGDAREAMATVARAMGKAEKIVDERTGEFKIYRQFAGFKLVASAGREEVCERVVTGTREIVEEVPDPDALAAVPKVTVTKVVEDIEWVCQPLLKPASTSILSVPAEVA